MRVLLKVFLFGLCIAVIMLIAPLAWLNFDSQGLPDIHALANFAPASATRAVDPCLKMEAIAIPYDSIGNNLRFALEAAEVQEDGPGVLATTLKSFDNTRRPHRIALSLAISRTMLYQPDRPLHRQLNELRAAMQLERNFSRRQLFTIYANRLYFGEKVVGVESAAQFYFHKEPIQLNIEEAALLAGMVRWPSYFSPAMHPENAIRRRNQVIDAMVQAHTVSESDAATFKSHALPAMK
jgi:membrane carboxypeptidase/penicillin-binding protein